MTYQQPLLLPTVVDVAEQTLFQVNKSSVMLSQQYSQPSVQLELVKTDLQELQKKNKSNEDRKRKRHNLRVWGDASLRGDKVNRDGEFDGVSTRRSGISDGLDGGV